MKNAYNILDCRGNLTGMIRGADGVGPLYRADFVTVGRIAEVVISVELAGHVSFV